MAKFLNLLRANIRAYSPLAPLSSPRSDLLRGWDRWRWLSRRRKAGQLLDPTIEIRHDQEGLQELDKRLRFGQGVAVDKGCIIWLGTMDSVQGEIELGARVYIGPYTFLGSCHRLHIGEDTLIGAQSYIITANHQTSVPDVPVGKQGYTGGDVRIGNNVWIGCHVVVLPGVTIGDNAIVGAGAVVTKNIPDGETWGGVPAIRIK